MKGEGEELGFFTRIKTKKLERAKAMDEIAALLRKEGVSVTGNQCIINGRACWQDSKL